MHPARNSHQPPLASLCTMGAIVLLNLGIITGLLIQALPGVGFAQAIALVIVEAAIVYCAYRAGRRIELTSIDA